MRVLLSYPFSLRPWAYGLSADYRWEHDVRGAGRCVIYRLLGDRSAGGSEVVLAGVEIASVEREAGGRDDHPDSVARLEEDSGCAKIDRVGGDLVGLEKLGRR